MKTAMTEVGLEFPFREVQATLTVCSVPSMSSPLLINVSGFLTKAERKQPDWLFAFIVYHELMHLYVRRIYDTSALRKKYAGEPLQTLNHIHVLALEKFALKSSAGAPNWSSWINATERQRRQHTGGRGKSSMPKGKTP